MPKYQVNLIQIIISIALFFMANFAVMFFSPYIANTTITFTMIYSFVTAFIFYFNYDMVKSHWLRFLHSKDKLLFTFIGIIAYMIILLINKYYFLAFIHTINADTFSTYFPLSIIFLFAYTLFYAFNISVVYKLISNFFKIHNRELFVIVISAIIFGVICSLSLFPTSVYDFSHMSVFYFSLTLVFSYLYNQTNTIMVPTISLTISFLILNIINIIL